MTKVVIRTGDTTGFFTRAKAAARKADHGGDFSRTVTLSFEDPRQMFAVLTSTRRDLMAQIMREPKSINELSRRLRRHRSAITKDIGLLERSGLLVSQRRVNPGHGIEKVVRSVAPKIELMATLE